MKTPYHDFEIELGQCCCGKPEIRVLESSFNRPRAPFHFDSDAQQALEEKVKEFEQLLLSEKARARRRRELSEEIGNTLYELLFPGAIGTAFQRSHDALRGNDGLRIRLSFGTPYDRRLGGLPWELTRDPKHGRFIATTARTSVARYLDPEERIRPLEVEPPLKVLVVIASPDPATSKRYEYSKIDPRPHKAILEDAINQTKYIELEILETATLTAMRKKLRRAHDERYPFHAVHFLGHGGFDERGDGALFFERPNGSEHIVTASEFARNVTDSVRLVVLASCETGKIPPARKGAEHAFSGVASALVASGLSAVVAMQYTVSEGAAATFAQTFYELIDQNRPIDEAVAEGRLAIESEGEEGAVEWATPVLFLRAADGRILDLRKGGVPPKKLAIFNVIHHGQEEMQNASVKVDLRSKFKDRSLRAGASWNETILETLRHKIQKKLPTGSPVHIEIAAPVSIAFAAGFLLPINKREPVTLKQRDEIWRFDGELPKDARLWLSAKTADARVRDEEIDFPFSPEEKSNDIALIVDGAHSILKNVADYLRRDDLDAPAIGHVVYAGFESAGHYRIKNGGHAQRLAEEVVARVKDLARHLGRPTIHVFSPGPNGLAFAVGRLSHVLPKIQLYEYDKEGKKRGSYEKSITLVPPEMGG